MSSLLLSRIIQPKLTISHPDDEHEREANRVADQVMRMAAAGGLQKIGSAAQVQRASGKYDSEGSSGRRLLAHALAHVVQQRKTSSRRGQNAARTATTRKTSPLRILRAATWTGAALHETNNLANSALHGVQPGVTRPVVNGTITATTPAVRAALHGPTVNVSPAASGGGFDATVTAVPANAFGVDETVLAGGPWRRVEPRARIGLLFPTLTQCAGAGDSDFRARGRPSDRHMKAASRRHEDRHAADIRAAFNGSVVPWDANLTAANTAAMRYHGATAADARAALVMWAGGTPDQVSDAFAAAVVADGRAYHATAAGGEISAPTDPTAARDCSWSFARYHNPS